MQILISLAVVAVIAVGIAVAVGGGDDADPATTTPTPEAQGLFEGIPASGMEVGEPDAPATLEEFIDPQCPFCAQFSNDVLPTVVEEYVETGRLKLVLRPLAFIGEDSVRAARAVAAAGEQDLAWPLMEAIFANQGAENSGYVTDDYLRNLASQIEGLDPQAIVDAANSEEPVPVLQEADARSDEFQVDSTPSFLITPESGRTQPLESNLEASAFTAALDEALGQ